LKVEFYNGTTLLATVSAAPYSFAWTAAVTGSYGVTARAYDNDQAVSTSAAVTVVVNSSPTVSLTAPANFAVLPAGAVVTLAASAADPDGTINKVEFYRGDVLLGQATTAPYSLPVTGLSNGPYVFKAKAYDNRGAVTESSTINVTIGSAVATPVTYIYDELGRLVGVQH
jgi:hypothetical protein